MHSLKNVVYPYIIDFLRKNPENKTWFVNSQLLIKYLHKYFNDTHY